MEHKQRAKMPASQRAKQFMPFAAVKGLEKAIIEQENQARRQPFVEQVDEEISRIDMVIRSLKKGMRICVTFFDRGQYRTVTGIVEEINEIQQILRVKEERIPFQRIQIIRVAAPEEVSG